MTACHILIKLRFQCLDMAWFEFDSAYIHYITTCCLLPIVLMDLVVHHPVLDSSFFSYFLSELVQQICCMHYQPYQENLILLSILVTLGGKSMWLDLFFSVFSTQQFMNLSDFPLVFNRFQRARPVLIDPGFYSSQKSDVFWVPEKRGIPTAFKLYTGILWS